MIPILQAPQKKPTFGQRLSEGVGRGLDMASQMMQEHQQKEATKAFGERLGLGDFSGLPIELQKEFVSKSLTAKAKSEELAAQLQANKPMIRALEKARNLPEGTLDPFLSDVKMAEQMSRSDKEKNPLGGLGGVPLTEEESEKIDKILKENPDATAEELEIAFHKAKIIPGRVTNLLESRRRKEEQISKKEEERTRALRQETLPRRQELANKAAAAQQGIENKQRLIDIIDRGDIDDPTFAAVAEAVPLNLGKRLLSNDTVEYKSGLVDEFKDLRNIFQGQTRIKEIDLLEAKIADLYLTDGQKKAVLKSRINALKADIIRAEVAQELENEPYGVLQFNQELEKRAKPRLEALFNQVLDDQKAIIQDAENRKKIPLDPRDPEDKKIMQQMLKEAGGDKQKAKEIAKQKGYTVKGV